MHHLELCESILLREAYIANTRNESVTLGDSDKLCNASFKFTYKAMSDVVSQVTPFAERGRVWSRCHYRVVTEEHNY